jgi:hypothetical protein
MDLMPLLSRVWGSDNLLYLKYTAEPVDPNVRNRQPASSSINTFGSDKKR